MKSRIQSKFTPFSIGDNVWLKARNLKRKVVDPKFAPKREGLFLITKVLSSLSYQLKLPDTWKIHPVFHASLLSLYHETDIHGSNFPTPPPDLIDNEEEYEIERIVKHKGRPKHLSFLIQWKGYSSEEDSWVPESDLGNTLEFLVNYKRRHKL